MRLILVLAFICLINLACSNFSSIKAHRENVTVAGGKLNQAKLTEKAGDYCFGTQNKGNASESDPELQSMSPKEMDVKFLLFTCKNKLKPRNFTYLSLPKKWKASTFNTKVITRFIVHGHDEKYPGDPDFNWMEQIKNLILQKACVNVVAIDWSKGASSPIYYPSAANTRVVGKMMGCVVNRWKAELNYSPERVHLIGHSLGGEVVGFAGKEVTNPKIGQITGLDPAGPAYQEFNDKNKLAVTDGQCVNVIHTNGARTLPIIDGLGHFKPMGHVDFYPNGGHRQPGCSNSYTKDSKKAEKTTQGFNIFAINSCSHIRSVYYGIADQNYTDANKCQIIGYRCTSYDDFNLGKCRGDCGADGSGCKLMPLNLDYWDDTKNCDPNGVHIEYYLNTGDISSPQQYCLFHYQIIVNIKGQVNRCLGEITIRLSNGKQIDVKLETKNTVLSKHRNRKFTKLFTDSVELGDFTGADIKSNLGLTCKVNKIEFNYMTSLDPSVRKRKSSTLCSTDGKTFLNKC